MSAHPNLTPLVNHLISTIFRSKCEKALAASDAIYYQRILHAVACVGLESAFRFDEGFETSIKARSFAIHGYAQRGKFPVNGAVEMRFLNASSQIMSNACGKVSEKIICTIDIIPAAALKNCKARGNRGSALDT
ncbi:hypothetical protein BGZ96_003564 [Linnemannia gamsii]|uniref:Uncharacterized protein n=1 Tax=Linnemannia gamsii TaxID=64522 RepID=A0ABQ7K7H6_9FUNG|nr:hypothetical protein BGZ96_003564 [Linnemannia gamsii]